ILEDIYIPHKLTDEGILIEDENAIGILFAFGFLPNKSWPQEELSEDKKPLEILNQLSAVKIKDKSGIYVGARLGRPEKAKQRKMTGRPHILFPVSTQGGRMRSLNEAMEKGYVESEFPVFKCDECNTRNILPKCEKCGKRLEPLRFCVKCKKETTKETHCGLRTVFYLKQKVNVREKVNSVLKRLDVPMPPLVKGVRGTSNKLRIPEPLEKGILRAIHGVYVNKDGTIRYDAIETPVTHFKPKEIGTSVERLKELGYTHDIFGKPLENDDQILEIFPQDVILPDCKEWPDASAVDMIYKTANFVDDLLEKYYHEKRYYNIRSPKDMIGQLIIALAPHTSAGMVGRIIGFSKTQCFFAHPYFHSAVRRNCFVSGTNIYYKQNGNLVCEPIDTFFKNQDGVTKYDDDGTEVKILNKDIYALGTDLSGKYEEHKIKLVFKRKHKGKVIKIIAENNQEVTVTPEHRLWVFNLKKKRLFEKRADNISKDDLLLSLDKIKHKPKDITLYLPEIFSNYENVVVRTNKKFAKRLIKELGTKKLVKLFGNKRKLFNYLYRKPYSIPLKIYLDLKKIINFKEDKFRIAFKRNFASLPLSITVNKEFARFLGYYVSEGWLWKSKNKGKESYHIGFAACDKSIKADIKKIIKKLFNIQVYEAKNTLTITNKLLFELMKYLNVGEKANKKSIPNVIYNSNEEVIFEFLKGVYQGDGSITMHEIKYTTVSKRLADELYFLLTLLGMKPTFKIEKEKKITSGLVYNKNPPRVDVYYISLYSNDVLLFSNKIRLIGKKGNMLKKISTKTRVRKIKIHKDVRVLKIKEISKHDYNGYVYDIELDDKNKVFACGSGLLLSHNCDGDEIGFMLLMDALLNFSRQYLPDARGSRHMDAPLVLTTRLIPEEVDDEVFNMDICDIYPIEFYEATEKWSSPYDVSIKQVKDTLGKPEQYRGFMFTHPVDDMNSGNRVSSYKTLTSVADKVKKQMELAEKIKAVDKSDVAKIVIEKHFLKDIKGNLRKFSRQEFRCIKCNEKYRRIPLIGRCYKCGGKLVLTVAEGTVSKYLEPSLNLAEKYSLPSYLRQTLEILKRRVESVFGKEKTKQKGLSEFFGG
ncbi:MAG: hypothetical protein J7K22_03870, partial [Nanoarchaeota archaeon]|nr:hypothetical protein [Nanoarchaeota archaeon]